LILILRLFDFLGRAIYGSKPGYISGYCWSVMLARVCQIYPHYKPYQLFKAFFEMYASWNWERPICAVSDFSKKFVRSKWVKYFVYLVNVFHYRLLIGFIIRILLLYWLFIEAIATLLGI
jgi:hypothetical protein